LHADGRTDRHKRTDGQTNGHRRAEANSRFSQFYDHVYKQVLNL